MTAYFNILGVVLGQMFVRGVAELSESYIAMRRLRKFLEYDEKKIISLEEIEKTLNGDVAEVILNIFCKFQFQFSFGSIHIYLKTY